MPTLLQARVMGRVRSFLCTGTSRTRFCWAHPHLRSDFHYAVRRFYKQSKVVFGSPTMAIDPCASSESFQAGGNLTIITGNMASRSTGQNIDDLTGLGRWSGVTLEGPDGCLVSIITAYRVCSGSPLTAPLGSSFLREYEYFKGLKSTSLNPRRLFLSDLEHVSMVSNKLDTASFSCWTQILPWKRIIIFLILSLLVAYPMLMQMTQLHRRTLVPRRDVLTLSFAVTKSLPILLVLVPSRTKKDLNPIIEVYISMFHAHYCLDQSGQPLLHKHIEISILVTRNLFSAIIRQCWLITINII